MPVLIRGLGAHLTQCLCLFTLSRVWNPASLLSANSRHTNSVLFSLIGLSQWQQGLSKKSGSKLQGNSTNTANTPGTLTSLGHIFVCTPQTTQWDAPISVKQTIRFQHVCSSLWRLLKLIYLCIYFSFPIYLCIYLLAYLFTLSIFIYQLTCLLNYFFTLSTYLFDLFAYLLFIFISLLYLVICYLLT